MTKAKAKTKIVIPAGKPAATPKARTAGLKPAITAAAAKAAHEAAAAEFIKKTQPRARKATAAVGTGLPYTGQIDQIGKRGQLKTSSILDEQVMIPQHAIAHVQANGVQLTDTDINRLVKAFQSASMPKIDDEPKASTLKEKPATALTDNMAQVKNQVNDLGSTIAQLIQALDPVLHQHEDGNCTDCDPSSVDGRGNSGVNTFLRDTALNVEALNQRLQWVLRSLEI